MKFLENVCHIVSVQKLSAFYNLLLLFTPRICLPETDFLGLLSFLPAFPVIFFPYSLNMSVEDLYLAPF